MTTNPNRAKWEGVKAWRDGVSRSACPYTDEKLRTAWIDGWTERDQRGERDDFDD
ncbi:ribosome modulation factor [Burkholderia ubonensis]|nr:ribosome modulation factor [Burkholderia ubonensis]